MKTTGSKGVPDASAPTTRERLIASAVELMVEHGSVEKVTLRSIASGAGVSPTAVYRHFADHAEMLGHATVWCWERFDEAVNGATSSIVDPDDALRAQCLAYLDFAERQPGVYRVLFSTVGSVGTVRSDVGGPIFDKLVRSVDAVLESLDDDRDPLGVALQLFAWIHGIADLRLANVELPFVEAPAQIEGLLGSLRLDGASR